jgi:hypothetical protein
MKPQPAQGPARKHSVFCGRIEANARALNQKFCEQIPDAGVARVVHVA